VTILKSAAFGLVIVIMYGLGSADPAAAQVLYSAHQVHSVSGSAAR
jgi:hypothetical protein